jgi:hypothetical protein
MELCYDGYDFQEKQIGSGFPVTKSVGNSIPCFLHKYKEVQLTLKKEYINQDKYSGERTYFANGCNNQIFCIKSRSKPPWRGVKIPPRFVFTK